MTFDEANIIGRIIGTADGGCSTCVGALVERLNAAFPDYVWTVTGEDTTEPSEWDPEELTQVGIGVAAKAAT